MIVAFQLVVILVFEVRRERMREAADSDFADGGWARAASSTVHRISVTQHVVFGLKILVAFLIPDIPGPVKMAIEREQYLQKIAFEGEEEGQIMSDTDLDEALDDMTHGKGKKRA